MCVYINSKAVNVYRMVKCLIIDHLPVDTTQFAVFV